MKTLKQIAWFFLIQGLLEILVFIFLTQKIISIIPGTITVFGAFYMLNLNKPTWAYFSAIWAFIKYNPISIAMFIFLATDLLHKGESSIKFLSIYLFISMALSITMGIITIVKTVKYLKKV